MNVQKQIVYANYAGATLLVLGLTAIGTGVGYYLSVQATLSAGCGTQILGEPTTCQSAIQTMNKGVMWCLGTGAFSLAAGIGIMYYLKRKVP